MDGYSLLLICLVVFSGILVPGIVFINHGKNTKNTGLMIAGWCMVGFISTVASIGLGYLIYEMPSTISAFLIISGPFLIFSGLIFTLVCGILFLIRGYYKDKDGSRPFKGSIITGWIMVGVNIAIITSIILLLALLATGIIPIRLM